MRHKSGEARQKFVRLLSLKPWALTGGECERLSNGVLSRTALRYYREEGRYGDPFLYMRLKAMMRIVLTAKRDMLKGGTPRGGTFSSIHLFTLYDSPWKFNVRAYLELPGYLKKYGYGKGERLDINIDPPAYFKVLKFIWEEGPKTARELAGFLDTSSLNIHGQLVRDWRLLGNRNSSDDRLVRHLTPTKGSGRKKIAHYDLTPTERKIWAVFNNKGVQKAWRDFQEHRPISPHFSWPTVFYA